MPHSIFIKYEDNGYWKNINYILDKISPETKLSASEPFDKDKLAPVSILHTLISSTQNNLPSYSSLSSFSYKSLSSLLSSMPKNTIVEVKEIDNVSSNVEIQHFSPNLLCKYYKKVLN